MTSKGNKRDQADNAGTGFVTQEQFALQEKMFRELMKTQEENFRSFVSMHIDSTNKRVDTFMVNVTKEVCDLKNSLEFSQGELEQAKIDLHGLPSTPNVTSNIDEALKTLTNNFKELEKQVEYIDNYSRRNSLVIKGIEESQNETWEDTERKVRDMIKDKLKLNESAIEIERAHRVAGTTDGTKNIAVKFLRFKDKDDILANAKNLKDTGISINQSFSDKLNNRRAELWQEVLQHRRAGKISYLSFDKVIVKNRTEARVVREQRMTRSRLALDETASNQSN